MLRGSLVALTLALLTTTASAGGLVGGGNLDFTHFSEEGASLDVFTLEPKVGFAVSPELTISGSMIFDHYSPEQGDGVNNFALRVGGTFERRQGQMGMMFGAGLTIDPSTDELILNQGTNVAFDLDARASTDLSGQTYVFGGLIDGGDVTWVVSKLLGLPAAGHGLVFDHIGGDNSGTIVILDLAGGVGFHLSPTMDIEIGVPLLLWQRVSANGNSNSDSAIFIADFIGAKAAVWMTTGRLRLGGNLSVVHDSSDNGSNFTAVRLGVSILGTM